MMEWDTLASSGAQVQSSPTHRHVSAPSCKVAVALARAVQAPLCVMGEVSLEDLSFSNLSCAGAQGGTASLDRALAEIARTIEGTLGRREASEGQASADVDFSTEDWNGGRSPG